MSRLIERVETWDQLVPHHHVAVKNPEEYLHCRGTSEEPCTMRSP